MNTKKNFNNKNQYDKQNRSNDKESKWAEEFDPRWITESLMLKSGQYDDAVSFAEKFGEDIAGEFTTNQIRNFFGEVRRIEMKGIQSEKVSFLLLRPKLSYAVKRNQNQSSIKFKEVVLKAHEAVMGAKDNSAEFEKRFQNFVDFLEAILAYHKAYGGK